MMGVVFEVLQNVSISNTKMKMTANCNKHNYANPSRNIEYYNSFNLVRQAMMEIVFEAF